MPPTRRSFVISRLPCPYLANFWLEGNRFLFEDVTGDSVKDYKGMWKSPLILQTFAAHMHFIQGAMDIPIDTGLKGNKYGHPKAALSLAGAAVCFSSPFLSETRTISIVGETNIDFTVDNALTFEVIPPSGKGKKRATGNEKCKANITGEMFKKDFWGHETVRFMQSIKGIPPKVWDEIIDATLQFVKETMRKPGRGVSSDDEDNTRALSDDDGDKFTDLMTYR
ncbi:hypothetical protein BU15DRAFT_71844 [Melanogaster broomeanus]|nr:hypothetical protein BU15DRAFT_71844 [Melanogaster broomeanus]